MKNKMFRIILKIHKKLPFVPFEQTLIKIYHSLQDRDKVVNKKINGINYQLDLSELIDNKVFYGNWEPKTTLMFKRIIKPNMVCLDVGANIGYYTLLLGKIMNNKGRIISFEPTNDGFKKLKINIGLNDFKNIKLEKLALSNENKEVQMKIRNSWKLSGLVDPKEEVINMVTLDNYIEKNKINKLDFIKIDVDGYEYEILKGAQQTLKKYKPILCLEIGYYEGKEPGYNLDSIVSFLQSLGYSFYSEEGKKFNSFLELTNHIPNNGAENFLLLHEKDITKFHNGLVN